MPVFLSVFVGLRSMANLPVESMTTGGIFWFTDLTVTDPFYALPVLTMTTLLATIEVRWIYSLKLIHVVNDCCWIMFFLMIASIVPVKMMGLCIDQLFCLGSECGICALFLGAPWHFCLRLEYSSLTFELVSKCIICSSSSSAYT